MIINKIHCFSGLIISIFVALHLFNHTISIVGAEQHIELMSRLRVFYRNIFIESILLIGIIFQIIFRLKYFFKQKNAVASGFEKLHLWTGLYLTFFLLIHVSAVMIGRFFFNLDTNFYFAVAGINTFPFSLFFIPYYGLAIFSFFSHLATAEYKSSESLTFRVFNKKKTIVIIAIGILLAFIILFGTTNRFRRFEIPEEYNMLEIKK